MSSNFHEGHRTNIIAFEVSKASLTVHSLPDDQQVTIPNTAPAIIQASNGRIIALGRPGPS